MGVILEPTAETSAWYVEVRRESAYLHRTDGDGSIWVNGVDGFAMRTAEVGHVLAALDQILAHPAFTAWTKQDEKDSDVAAWTIVDEDGWRRVIGPVIVFGGSAGTWSPGAVELTYASLHSLRSALEGEADRTIRHGTDIDNAEHDS